MTKTKKQLEWMILDQQEKINFLEDMKKHYQEMTCLLQKQNDLLWAIYFEQKKKTGATTKKKENGQ